MKDTLAVVARLLLATIFLVSGYGKLGPGYAGTQQYMESMGVSSALLPLVIVAELGGGVGVLLGALTRVAAVALAGFTLLAAFLFHAELGDRIQAIMFMKNLAIAGGLLMLAIHGAGAISIDAWWQHRRRRGVQPA